MHKRYDAGYCAALLTTFVHDLADDIGGGQVASVGFVELKPNVINVLPAHARVNVDLRNANNELLVEAEQKSKSFLAQLASDKQVEVKTKNSLDLTPLRLISGLLRSLKTPLQH